ncbi:hypothetical protein LHGZ1_0095 [Laribacter hongkongensis]|uniref:Uncharacterized protein n=1 Tax=Laribacter hongkongensis TaxID=168471 RepID=A0A248LEV7_9NEIS|nr:hypothetical protein LHGZ1_0095 [Laribacter hongkongensis]
MAASCTATCAHRADAATTGTGPWRRRPVMRQGPVPARQVYQAATQAFAAPRRVAACPARQDGTASTFTHRGPYRL